MKISVEKNFLTFQLAKCRNVNCVMPFFSGNYLLRPLFHAATAFICGALELLRTAIDDVDIATNLFQKGVGARYSHAIHNEKVRRRLEGGYETIQTMLVEKRLEAFPQTDGCTRDGSEKDK